MEAPTDDKVSRRPQRAGTGRKAWAAVGRKRQFVDTTRFSLSCRVGVGHYPSGGNVISSSLGEAGLAERPAKGEITLVIGAPERGAGGVQVDTSQSLAARVDELMHQAKLDRKEALKLAAKERGIPKRDAYKQMLDQGDVQE